MTANTDVHTCSYYCERAECIRRQRDELRGRMESALAAPQRPAPHPATTHCENCGCDWIDNGLNPVGCPYCKQSEQAAEIERLLAERDALAALAQQRAAVDGAMVKRFLEAFQNTPGDEAIGADEKVARRWLTAALAAHRKQGDEQ